MATLIVLSFACEARHSQPAPSTLTSLSYIVLPHPDDEMQAWSLIENTTEDYKVFIVLTRGEQTAYCATSGFDEGTGEQAPSPWPTKRWTTECEQARQNSFLNFIHAMSDGDEGLSSFHTYGGKVGPFDDRGYGICRYDEAGCVLDRTAEIWTSPISTVVWFNLGDGDLTEAEVSWAIETVHDNKATLGIVEHLPTRALVGASYWNDHYADCFQYSHNDHRAVRDALWNHDFGLGPQIAATCPSDPSVSLSEEVSFGSFSRAFGGENDRDAGVHAQHYGWLFDDAPGSWPGDPVGQDELFHRNQHFRVRYGD